MLCLYVANVMYVVYVAVGECVCYADMYVAAWGKHGVGFSRFRQDGSMKMGLYVTNCTNWPNFNGNACRVVKLEDSILAHQGS